MAAVALIALPLAAGCGGDSGSADSSQTTAAAATTAISSACSTALKAADNAAKDAGPTSEEIGATIFASLDACTGDEYIAATNAAFPDANFTPTDFIALCDGNRPDSGEWPAGCAAVATLTAPRWKAACADVLASWDNDQASVCEVRKT